MSKLSERDRVPRLLLVEDNSSDALLLHRALKQVGYDVEVHRMSTVEQALDFLDLVKTDPKALPDLIVSDLNLPGRSGIDFLRILKRHELFRRIPCILLTSSQAENDIDEAYDSYASGYMSKPITIEEYQRVIAAIGFYWFDMAQLPCGSVQKSMDVLYKSSAL